jgi:hypothetical protein
LFQPFSSSADRNCETVKSQEWEFLRIEKPAKGLATRNTYLPTLYKMIVVTATFWNNIHTYLSFLISKTQFLHWLMLALDSSCMHVQIHFSFVPTCMQWCHSAHKFQHFIPATLEVTLNHWKKIEQFSTSLWPRLSLWNSTHRWRRRVNNNLNNGFDKNAI